MPEKASDVGTFDAIIVGTGVGGLYAIHRLRKLGLKVRAFEAAGGVGHRWDSPKKCGSHGLEGTGFEPSVPRGKGPTFVCRFSLAPTFRLAGNQPEATLKAWSVSRWR